MKPLRVFALTSFALVCLAGAMAGEDKKDEGQNSLKVSIEAVDVQGGVYVGKPLHLKVILHNTTDKPLLIQDWQKCPHVITLQMATKDYPGQSGGSWGPIGFGRTLVWRGGLRSLPPGETVVERFITLAGNTVVERSITPMIPGDVRIAVQVWCPANALGETKEEKASWQGKTRGYTEVLVSSEMSSEMAARFEMWKKKLNDPEATEEEQLKILADAAAEKHYFAAHFIRDACGTLPPGPVREAAIKHLVGLAKFGTAYESFPFLLEVMGDDKTPQETREDLLGWVGEILKDHGHKYLAGQAWHHYPEPLLKQAKDLVEQLAKDRNPYVAAKAREVLKALEEKKAKPAYR